MVGNRDSEHSYECYMFQVKHHRVELPLSTCHIPQYIVLVGLRWTLHWTHFWLSLFRANARENCHFRKVKTTASLGQIVNEHQEKTGSLCTKVVIPSDSLSWSQRCWIPRLQHWVIVGELHLPSPIQSSVTSNDGKVTSPYSLGYWEEKK